MTKIKMVTSQLYRGPYPEKFLSTLQREGVTNILTLQSGARDLLDFNGLYTLDRKAHEHGMEQNYFPQSFLQPPSKQECEEICLFIDRVARAGGKTYLHCTEGVDRTGRVVVHYRVTRMGWALEDAISEWVEMGHHTKRYFWWRNRCRKDYAK